MSHDTWVGYNTTHSLRHMTTYRHCISPTRSLTHRLAIGRHLTFREREKNESMHGNFNGQRSKKDIGYTARSFLTFFPSVCLIIAITFGRRNGFSSIGFYYLSILLAYEFLDEKDGLMSSPVLLSGCQLQYDLILSS
jgi:hypothetical protein